MDLKPQYAQLYIKNERLMPSRPSDKPTWREFLEPIRENVRVIQYCAQAYIGRNNSRQVDGSFTSLMIPGYYGDLAEIEPQREQLVEIGFMNDINDFVNKLAEHPPLDQFRTLNPKYEDYHGLNGTKVFLLNVFDLTNPLTQKEQHVIDEMF